MFQKALPDMFRGSQVEMTGRFRGNVAGTVKISGMANGADESYKISIKSPEARGANTFLPRIWAQRKLGYLIDQVRLSDNPAGKTELLDEIVRLSKEYGIITDYTSFLVDEPEQRRLGLQIGAPGNDLTALSTNHVIIRQEVANRAVQFGISSANVTDQSGRAKDLRGSDIAASRYQSANGSVAFTPSLSGGFGGGGAGGPLGRIGPAPRQLQSPDPAGGGLIGQGQS